MGEFMYNLKNGRVGRLPIWLVGLLLAGAVALFVWYRNRNANKAIASTAAPDMAFDYDATGDSGYVDGLSGDAIGDYLRNDPTNPAYPVGLNAQGLPGPVTNAQWSRLAADNLMSKGADPSLVSNALAKYLQGQQISAAEQAIVNMALSMFGSPPEGLIIVNPSPNTPPGTSDPQGDGGLEQQTWFGRSVPYTAYVTQPGDTWLSIYNRFAPLYDPDKPGTEAGWWTLYKYNNARLGLSDTAYSDQPNKPIPAGTVVGIPNASGA